MRNLNKNQFKEWMGINYQNIALTEMQELIAEHYLSFPDAPPMMVVSYGHVIGNKTIINWLQEFKKEKETLP